MNKKPRTKKPTSSNPIDDLLDKFCAEVDYDQVSFRRWNQANHSLDIQYPLFLSSDEATAGGTRDLVFYRTIVTTSEGKMIAKTKEKITFQIQWPGESTAGQTLVYSKIGDVRDGKKGRLIVVIKIR